MILQPQLYNSFFLRSIVIGIKNRFALKVAKVTKPISNEEICFYLQQALDVCYATQGKQIPLELKTWVKRGVKIDFIQLPKNIQEGITGILLHSPLAKSIIIQIIFNLPHQ